MGRRAQKAARRRNGASAPVRRAAVLCGPACPGGRGGRRRVGRLRHARQTTCTLPTTPGRAPARPPSRSRMVTWQPDRRNPADQRRGRRARAFNAVAEDRAEGQHHPARHLQDAAHMSATAAVDDAARTRRAGPSCNDPRGPAAERIIAAVREAPAFRWRTSTRTVSRARARWACPSYAKGRKSRGLSLPGAYDVPPASATARQRPQDDDRPVQAEADGARPGERRPRTWG